MAVNACPMCLAEESIDHLLLNCNFAYVIWTSIFSGFHFSAPLHQSVPALFEFWGLGVGSKRGRSMWKLSFLAAIWSIWKERNRRCFEGKVANVNMVVEAVKRSVALWVSLLPQFKGISMPSIFQNWKETADSCPHSMRHTPRWFPPPRGSLKLNFDGSACGN